MSVKLSMLESLTNIGLCRRCVISHTKTNLVPLDYQVEQESTKEEDKRYCGSCFGILEEKQIQNATQKIAKELKICDYESPSFSLAISLPQAFVIRQKSIITHLKEIGVEEKTLEFSQSFWKDAVKYSILPELEKQINKKHDNKSELLVNLIYNYKDDGNEISKLSKLLPYQNTNKRKANSKQRYHHNKKVNHPDNSIVAIINAVEKLNPLQVKHYTSVPPDTIIDPCDIDVKICQGSLFFAGRYNKYSRELSQTPWFIDGIKKTETSVQELICGKIQDALRASEVKFISSGREDVDVKMLGKGRPFAVELVDPKRLSINQSEVTKLQNDVNISTDLIAIRDLQIINREGLSSLKQGEEEKTKSYRAKLWSPVPISDEKIQMLNNMKDIMLAQKTPLRVLHRRSIDTRNRAIHEVFMERLDNDHYSLKMKTQAGTYIKEFVHSDFGRTEPSMCTLLDAPVDILELDVEAVELDWPPSLDT